MAEDNTESPPIGGLEGEQFLQTVQQEYNIHINFKDFIRFIRTAGTEINSPEDFELDEALQYTEQVGQYTILSVVMAELLRKQEYTAFDSKIEQRLREEKPFSPYKILSVGGTESEPFQLLGAATVSISPGIPENLHPNIPVRRLREKMNPDLIQHGHLHPADYDIIISSRVFEDSSGLESQDSRPAAQAMIEVLKPGGLLIQRLEQVQDKTLFGGLSQQHVLLIPQPHAMRNEIISVRKK